MTPDKKGTLYQKATRYCGYQERTEKEVLEKLRAWGVTQKEAAHLIRVLKTENFLNEKRYIEAFIRGKFMDKKWGKRKLLATLTAKDLDQALIQRGLDAIEPTDYLQRLRHVAEKKKQTLASATAKQTKQKLINYLLQKGYEPDLVAQTVKEITAR